ncbi:adenosine receptor A1-like [Oculina patagonica]
MVLRNSTVVEKTYKQLYCTADVTGGMNYQLACLSVVNIFLSITAALGNTLILAALHKKSSLHPPSKLMFRCLATTDLGIGVITQPLYVIYLMSVMNERWNICRYALALTFITGYTFGTVSLLTLTVIGVDRLLALLLGLRYKEVVTLKRTFVVAATFWGFSLLFATMYLLNYNITLWLSYAVLSLCLVTVIFCYTKIFLGLRHQRTQVVDGHNHQQTGQTNPLNLARYRKAVSSAVWVQLTLVGCYLPYGVTWTFPAYRQLSSTVVLAKYATLSLVYLNSSLNPFLYCWKIKRVRQAVKETMREIFCW